ncbi:MAG: magnesium and cobalt transport protein CorA [Prevotellaceae bacterium]|jgi:magnesium transporter|nr:magnesium and cobalt transport protein CorA [Prevotellaceae bacterium]
MVIIYYKTPEKIVRSSDIKLLDQLKRESIIWIDLIDPSGDDKRKVEDFLGTDLQSRSQAEEIESSSRYSETETEIFANTNFLISQPDSFTYETVSFTITNDGIMATLHNSDLRTLNEIGKKIQLNHKINTTGYHLMVAILESRIDLDADMVEGIAKEIAYLSKQINLGNKVNEDMLLDISQLQENTMVIRENIIDKQRVVSSILRSSKFPADVYPILNVLIKDVNSLINHTDFSFDRLEYLQNTIVGLINIEQNKIIKVFTVVTVFFMPPTLIASMYGMNLWLPLFGDGLDLVVSVVLMIVSVIITFFFFKRKKIL